ncbi:unnamed protein product [Allacma fusca]|uniref:Uncharacterized protein n=1 Tax=Allacma fusca TaxID=39272 RepID=A0A8J2PK61_9HEXA|nr:unnamed protein product [Allacma fusca]
MNYFSIHAAPGGRTPSMIASESIPLQSLRHPSITQEEPSMEPLNELTPLRTLHSSIDETHEDSMSPDSVVSSPVHPRIRPTTSSSGSNSSGTPARKRLVRQGSSIMEAPTDSTGAIIITPWW